MFHQIIFGLLAHSWNLDWSFWKALGATTLDVHQVHSSTHSHLFSQIPFAQTGQYLSLTFVARSLVVVVVLLQRQDLTSQRLYHIFHLSHATRDPPPSYQLASSLKSGLYLANCPPSRRQPAKQRHLLQPSSLPVYNQSHRNGIRTLIATIMKSRHESAQNDLNDVAVRCHVPTCANLYEVSGNKHTTENHGRTETTKLG